MDNVKPKNVLDCCVRRPMSECRGTIADPIEEYGEYAYWCGNMKVNKAFRSKPCSCHDTKYEAKYDSAFSCSTELTEISSEEFNKFYPEGIEKKVYLLHHMKTGGKKKKMKRVAL